MEVVLLYARLLFLSVVAIVISSAYSIFISKFSIFLSCDGFSQPLLILTSLQFVCSFLFCMLCSSCCFSTSDFAR